MVLSNTAVALHCALAFAVVASHCQTAKAAQEAWFLPGDMGKKELNSSQTPLAASNCVASDFELPQELQDIRSKAPLPPFITTEIFATVDALKNGITPGLALYETPIRARFVHLIDVMNWNCAAMYSTSWKDALTMDDPLLRAPSTTTTGSSLHSSPTRLLCMVHAWAAIVNEWIPEAQPTLSAVLRTHGYKNVEYGFNDEVDAAFDIATGVPILEVLGQVAASNCYSPKIMGAIVARQVTEYGRRDGYNMYGDLNRDGTPCEGRCPRFTDPTGYRPGQAKGKEKKGKGKKGAQKFRWQPMLEENGRGYFSRQEHVTPHIGTLAKHAFLTDNDFQRRVAPKPNYDYDKESLTVSERLKATATDDLKKAKIEFFDNKIMVTFAVIATAASYGTSFEQLLNFVVGITASEYESVLVAWKEKVFHDLVRPTTWIQEEMSNVEFETYGGPNQGVKTIKGKNFDAWIRIMPHSEYVSGSGCICQAIKDFTEMWFELTDSTLNASGLGLNTFTPGGSIAIPIATDITGREAPFVAGSSRTEPGVTPAADLTLVEPNLTSLRDSCGESRLDGGMHFSQSIAATYELCEGIGTQGADYAMDLLGGAGWG
mmetsp:Transcript_27224/g.55708  ORF Transcript_27224/g.55708 Transcript_27224/m.55708 type:complete len:601 (-) Transcript_27224:126-1928(-)